MRYYAGYAGLDVLLAKTSVCVVDEEGKILRNGAGPQDGGGDAPNVGRWHHIPLQRGRGSSRRPVGISRFTRIEPGAPGFGEASSRGRAGGEARMTGVLALGQVRCRI